jgi:pimeloyl-ACP methyl ester carboxylesterase
MSTQPGLDERRRGSGDDPRERLLAGIPVTERRLQLAGVSTAVLEGGDGPPVVLLHDPGEYGAKWMQVIPDLVMTHRVVAPDLPGHGTSEVADGPLDADRVLAWLGELVDRTCPSPPALVGLILGGAIAARFAAEQSDRLNRLVLVDSLGLAPFRPTPEFERALIDWTRRPNEATHERIWQRCAFDLDRLRDRMGDSWEAFAAYNIDRGRTASVQAAVHTLMEQFGVPAIPSTDLVRITAPTSLIWGRHDLATSLQVAESVSAEYGWPLHVIEDCADDPPIEQPAAFLRALRAALGPMTEEGATP